MKKLIFLLLLIPMIGMAHTYKAKGYCSILQKSVFEATLFGYRDSVEIQVKPYLSNTWTTTLKYVTRSSGNTDTIVGINQNDINEPCQIRFRWKTRNSNGSYQNWSSYFTVTASNSVYGGNCGALPVKWAEFLVTSIDADNVSVTFTTYETEGVKQFNIQVSTDGKTFKTVAIVFPNGYQPNSKYKAIINVKNLR